MNKAFLTPKIVDHEVNEELLEFFPVSLGVVFQLKDVLRPLAFGLASIMSDTGSDRGYTTTKDSDGFEQSVVNPITVDLARYRAEEKQRAILDFMEAFSDKKSRYALGRLIMDSLRNEFPRKFEHRDVEEFMDAVDADTMSQLLVGVARANKGVFGPFGDMLTKLVSKNVKQALESEIEPEIEVEVEVEVEDQSSRNQEAPSETSTGETSAPQ